jgi:hypothetical protein
MHDVCQVVLDERNAVHEARGLLVDALLRPSANLIPLPPHESISPHYLELCYTSSKTGNNAGGMSPRLSRGMSRRLSLFKHLGTTAAGNGALATAQTTAVAAETTMGYTDVLLHRGGIFYAFMKKHGLALDDAVNLLVSWRMQGKPGMTKVSRANLMRAVDRNGKATTYGYLLAQCTLLVSLCTILIFMELGLLSRFSTAALSADKDLSEEEFFHLLLPKGQEVKRRRDSFLVVNKGGGAAVQGTSGEGKEGKEGKEEMEDGGVVGVEEEDVGVSTASVEDLNLRSKEELVAMLQKAWAEGR